MKKEECTLLINYSAKFDNTRAEVEVWRGNETGDCCIIVATRRLIDRKKRLITSATINYGANTIDMLLAMLTHLKGSGTWNRHLHKGVQKGKKNITVWENPNS